MGIVQTIRPDMASPWRRRPMCLLIAGTSSPAALTRITGSGAFVETPARADLGDLVELHHPDAGAIRGRVIALTATGLTLSFDGSEHAVSFALAAISADMSNPNSRTQAQAGVQIDGETGPRPAPGYDC